MVGGYYKHSKGDTYRVLYTAQQKESDGMWYPSVVYRSTSDGELYSRRLTSFVQSFCKVRPSIHRRLQVFVIWVGLCLGIRFKFRVR